MSLQGVKNIVPTANPKSGVTRSYLEVVESGIDRNNPSPESTLAIKAALGIQGDAVGTLNTQEMFNKTMDGGLFTS